MAKKKASKNLPSVGFAMISYNDEKLVGDCLKSIFNQNYPKNKIKVVFADGGSTDKTLTIAKKYGVKIISRPDLVDFAYKRGALSVKALDTDLLMSFSMDNRLQEKNCLKNMVRALDNPEIVGAETLRYGWRKSDPPLCRYFALIGGADPIAVGLGKADRGPYDKNKWHGFGVVKDHTLYYEIAFSKDISRIPTLGANGFLVRRKIMRKYGKYENIAHIDACVRLIKSGYNKFAFVKKNHVVHYINMSLWTFIKRRLIWAELYSSNNMTREYSVLTKKDLFKLILIIFFYLTIVVPLFRAVIGYIKKPDPAWFLHIIVAPAFVLGYGLATLKGMLKK